MFLSPHLLFCKLSAERCIRQKVKSSSSLQAVTHSSATGWDSPTGERLFCKVFYKFKSISQIQFTWYCDTTLVHWYVHRGCNTRLGINEVLGVKYFQKSLQSNFSRGIKTGNLPAAQFIQHHEYSSGIMRDKKGMEAETLLVDKRDQALVQWRYQIKIWVLTFLEPNFWLLFNQL